MKEAIKIWLGLELIGLIFLAVAFVIISISFTAFYIMMACIVYGFVSYGLYDLAKTYRKVRKQRRVKNV